MMELKDTISKKEGILIIIIVIVIMKALKCRPSLKAMTTQLTSTYTHTHPMYTVKQTEYSA